MYLEVYDVIDIAQKGATIRHTNRIVFLFGWETNGIKNLKVFMFNSRWPKNIL